MKVAPPKPLGSDIDRLIEEGLARYGAGDLDGALLIWDKVLAIEPDNAQATSAVAPTSAPPRAMDPIVMPLLFSAPLPSASDGESIVDQTLEGFAATGARARANRSRTRGSGHGR